MIESPLFGIFAILNETLVLNVPIDSKIKRHARRATEPHPSAARLSAKTRACPRNTGKEHPDTFSASELHVVRV